MQTNQLKLRSRLAILAIVAFVPTGIADTFTTFDHGESFQANANGAFHAEHFTSPGTGVMELYASGTIEGGVDVTARVGATYTLNAGDLLTPFTAVTTAEGTAFGTITCLNLVGGTEAVMQLSLQQWRQAGAAWTLVASQFVAEWRCPANSVVLEDITGTAAFTYEPDTTYRVVLQAFARARATEGSTATVDFCASGTAQCGVAPEGITLEQIKIPNQVPKVLFHDTQIWYVDALANRARVTGRACDADGTVVDITISVAGQAGATTTPVQAVCGDGQHTFLPLLPGAYIGVAQGRDDEGGVGLDVGTVEITLLPPINSASLAAQQPTKSLTHEVVLDAEGTITGERWTMDGRVVSDTIPAGALGRKATMNVDLEAQLASVTVDGLTLWSGAVEAPGGNWMDLRAR